MKKIKLGILVEIILLIYFIFLQPIGICEVDNVKTLYVGGTSNGNFTYIQDAINNSTNGDVIFVYNGVYHENIIINKSINLIGENRNNTIIDGKENPEIIKLNSSYVNITNIKIQNGTFCGILIEYSIDCNIYQNLIKNILNGINIVLSNNINIFNNTISNCSGIGIKILEFKGLNNSVNCSEKNTIYHNNFINNSIDAYDECNNIWFYDKEGNYWDKYIGLDKNNNGIGDEPYKILGGDNSDGYPLMIPYYGVIMYKNFYVDENTLYYMLLISIIVAIIFLIPIAIYWRKKYLSSFNCSKNRFIN